MQKKKSNKSKKNLSKSAKETFHSDIRTRSVTRPLPSKSDNDIISDQSALVVVDGAKESTSSDNVTAVTDLVVIAVDKTGDTSEPKKTVSFHSFFLSQILPFHFFSFQFAN